MSSTPEYRFIKGYPLFLPIAWGYRILRLIKRDIKGAKKTIRTITISKKNIDERERELEKWGIFNKRDKNSLR